MSKRKLVINPFEYEGKYLDEVAEYANVLKNSFDIYIILKEDPAPNQYIEDVKYVRAGSRESSYLEVTADFVIDAGAIAGSNKFSASQKRICFFGEKIKEKLLESNKPASFINALDYLTDMDIVVTSQAADIDNLLRNTLGYKGEIISDVLPENNPDSLISRLGMDTRDSEFKEILFLVNCLNKEDKRHSDILKSAKTFREKFNTKAYMISLREIDASDNFVELFDTDNIVDIKLSKECNPGTVKNIILETDGIVVVCQKNIYRQCKKWIQGKRVLYMYPDKKRGDRETFFLKDKDLVNDACWRKVLGALDDKRSTSLILKKPIWDKVKRRFDFNSEKSSRKEYEPDEKRSQIKNRQREMMPLVSVVIPFYNDNATINSAVESIRSNGYDNYEILLINDGSEENPFDVIKEDPKTKYFVKENGGPGSARNLGMSEAEGKYLLFLDADDISIPGGIKALVDYAEENSLDMVCGKTILVYNETGKEEDWYGNIYSKPGINEISMRGELIDDTLCHGKLYSLNHIKTKGILFGDGLYEDNDFMSIIYTETERIGIIPTPVQKWIKYGNNTSRSTEITVKNVQDRLYVEERIFDRIRDSLKPYYTRQYLRHHIIASVFGFIKYTEHEKKQVYEMIKKGVDRRGDYIIDKLILVPSKREFYKAVLEDDYARFEEIANGFSDQFFTK